MQSTKGIVSFPNYTPERKEGPIPDTSSLPKVLTDIMLELHVQEFCQCVYCLGITPFKRPAVSPNRCGDRRTTGNFRRAMRLTCSATVTSYSSRPRTVSCTFAKLRQVLIIVVLLGVLQVLRVHVLVPVQLHQVHSLHLLELHQWGRKKGKGKCASRKALREVPIE